MSEDLQSLLKENRSFPPTDEFRATAHIKSVEEYKKLYQESIDDPDGFWSKIADELHWHKRWDKMLDWSNPPFAKWFIGGQTNLAYNCLDRHLTGPRRNKAAVIWEGEPGEVVTLTYAQLHREVCKFANVLETTLGVKKGDRVAIYMPMIPELSVAMLACARIGATHSIIFGGFAPQAIIDRVNDAECNCVITADGGYRRGKPLPLKVNVDEAMKQCPTVKHVVTVNRCDLEVTMSEGRDHWWHELMADAPARHEAPALDSEHPLFILYTSGTTGKPKGVVHTTGGYMVGTYLTTKWIFDMKEEDVYWCTADIGWVTGHSYIVYGPMANGATVMMYEGSPDTPGQDRFWDIVERHGVTLFYTAPTAIRTFMKWGTDPIQKHDLSSLRLLGSVGEPINPEAWMWYRKEIGGDRCPIVDTWWQTETGGVMITTLPGANATKPGSAGLPFFGVHPVVVDSDGQPVEKGKGGLLIIDKPWPSMLRTLYKDDERFEQNYWSMFKGKYLTGDGCRIDEDGYYWLMGRVDDVINISGHRLGTMEIESALVSHPKVAEAAVVAKPDEIKGSAIIAFVTLEGKAQPSVELKEELTQHVAKEIGALAKPQQIRWANSLPKTRSGKIMRRLLKELAEKGNVTGDTTTLEDMSVVAKLAEEED